MEYIVSIDDSSAGAVIIQLQSSNCGMYYRVYVQAGYRPPEKYAISSKQQAETTRRENTTIAGPAEGVNYWGC